MAFPARSLHVLALAVLSTGTSCSLWEKSKGMIFEEEVAPAIAADPAPQGPRALPDRYPYLRFLSHPDDTYTALVTVPSGAGDKMLSRLKFLCTMDDEAEPVPVEGVVSSTDNPKLRMEKGGGGVFLADASKKPWDAVSPAANWKDLEDLILITGTETEVVEVLDAIDLWYNASPQIEIQAAIIDVTNNELFERGIIQADGQPILENVSPSTFLKALGGGFPSNSNPGFGGGKGSSGLGGVFRLGFVDADFQLDAYLQFLQQEGILQITTQPSVVTRNGVAALLKATEDIPFLQPQGNINLAGAVTYSIVVKSVGVTLNVVPFLVGGDTLHLVINAEVSRLGRDFVVGVDSNNNAITVPSTTQRIASTEVLVRSGQRVIFGGLRLEETRKQQSKVPILGDVPLIGWLFSNTQDVTQDTTIYFVITPTVKPVPTIERIGDIFDPFAK